MGNKDESEAKKWKVIMLEVKLELNISGIIKEIASQQEERRHSRHAKDSLCARGTSWRWAYQHRGGSDCDERNENPEEATPTTNVVLKAFLEILHNSESAKDKISEVDPDLGKRMMTCQCREKILAPYHSYPTRRRQHSSNYSW